MPREVLVDLSGGGEWVNVEISWEGTDAQGRPIIYVARGVKWVARPIVLDLDGDGFELRGLDNPLIADLLGDGRAMRRTWVDPDDGLLVYDVNQNGIGSADEWILTTFAPDAATDLEALKTFDSNSDGVFDARDAEFSKFRVGRDLNQNGWFDAGEMMTLAQAGIVQFNLSAGVTVPTGASRAPVAGVEFAAVGQFVRANGTVGSFADASFAADAHTEVAFTDANFIVQASGTRNSLWSLSTAALTMDVATFSYGGYSNFVDVFGSVFADSIVGNAADNVLMGAGGRDTLLGGAGDDMIVTDSVALTTGRVLGGDGRDTLVLTTASPTTYDATAGGFEIVLAGGGADRLSATGYIRAGTTGVTFFGGDGADRLTGGVGNDQLIGGSGSDTLAGGEGNDVITIDASDNLANISGGGGYVHSGGDSLIVDATTNINISNLYRMGFQQFFGGDGNDTVYASRNDTEHYRERLSNILSGGRGNDFIFGGAGADTYLWHRGDGHDRFVDRDYAETNPDIVSLTGIRVQDITVSVSGGFRITIAQSAGGGSISLEGFRAPYGPQALIQIDGRDYRYEDIVNGVVWRGAAGHHILDVFPVRGQRPDNPDRVVDTGGGGSGNGNDPGGGDPGGGGGGGGGATGPRLSSGVTDPVAGLHIGYVGPQSLEQLPAI